MNKILLGIPCTDYVRAKTLATAVSLVKHAPSITVLIKQGCYIHKNREEIAQEAVNGGFTHLFFVDSDMCFGYQVLDRLLSRDADIVGGVYKYRREEKEYVLRLFGEGGQPILAKEIPEGLFKCFGIGAGCLLIKTSVFKKIPKPWFPLEIDQVPLGEDLAFCKKAQDYGFTIWADSTVEVLHIGEYLY